MSTIVYLDGQFITASEAKVSLLDRAYLFGDSVFDTLRGYHGVPFRLGQHLDRLMHSARVLGIRLAHDRVKLADLVQESVRRTGLDDAYVRITLSRGEGGRGLSPVGCDTPVLSIIARPLSPYPAEAYRDGIRTKTVNTRRVPAACLDPSIKCGNYLPSIMARRELDGAGMMEGVQLGVDGTVVCGTVSNLFIVRDGGLLTPDLASGCLPGVTRAAILELAAAIGLECTETTVHPGDLAAANEMFFCNTVMECLPVAELDGRRFAEAPGKATRRIQKELRELVERETRRAVGVSGRPTMAAPRCPPAVDDARTDKVGGQTAQEETGGLRPPLARSDRRIA